MISMKKPDTFGDNHTCLWHHIKLNKLWRSMFITKKKDFILFLIVQSARQQIQLMLSSVIEIHLSRSSELINVFLDDFGVYLTYLRIFVYLLKVIRYLSIVQARVETVRFSLRTVETVLLSKLTPIDSTYFI